MFIQIYFTIMCMIAAIVLFMIAKNEFINPFSETSIGGIIIATVVALPMLMFIPWIWDTNWCNTYLT